MQYAPQFYNGIALQPASESNVIARFGDDTPFLIERSQGTSAVLLYNCGLLAQQATTSMKSGLEASLTPNDLFVNPYFLPILQQSVLYAAIASNNILTWGGHVGDTYTAHYPRGAGGKAIISYQLSITDHEPEPSLNENRFTEDQGPKTENPSTVVPIAEDGTLRFQDTERPGIYQVEVRTQDRIRRDFFAVNVDTTEADLTEIPLSQVAARIGAKTTADPEIGETPEAADAYNVKRHGREIWGELLIFVICLMLLESFLSNRERALTVGES